MGDEAQREAAGAANHQELLGRLSRETALIQKDTFGKGPVAVRSYLFDDLLLVVMRDGLTVAEKTMLEFGQGDLVRQFRQTFENEMTEPLRRYGRGGDGTQGTDLPEPDHVQPRCRHRDFRLRPRA
jgi:hypothetical protein